MIDTISSEVKMLTIKALGNKYKVWTKRLGHNNEVKILLLHGGPGASHKMLECFSDYLLQEGVELYYYDQLGSYLSDKPTNDALWTIDRFVDEVEQVRKGLGLNKENLYLFGQSWGGILALEYALKYQQNLKGMIVSSVQASFADYNDYALEVLAKHLEPDALKEILALEIDEAYDNPRYMDLLQPFYQQFILRLNRAEWPAAVVDAIKHINQRIYHILNGPSELGVKGTLSSWNIQNELSKITVPTLVIGSKYNTVDPVKAALMATQVAHGEYLHCPNGSHLAMWDDSEIFFKGLINFIHKIENPNIYI